MRNLNKVSVQTPSAFRNVNARDVLPASTNTTVASKNTRKVVVASENHPQIEIPTKHPKHTSGTFCRVNYSPCRKKSIHTIGKSNKSRDIYSKHSGVFRAPLQRENISFEHNDKNVQHHHRTEVWTLPVNSQTSPISQKKYFFTYYLSLNKFVLKQSCYCNSRDRELNLYR